MSRAFVVLSTLLVVCLPVGDARAQKADARDPGTWRLQSAKRIPPAYWQGITTTPTSAT